jgi:hypothetical protein
MTGRAKRPLLDRHVLGDDTRLVNAGIESQQRRLRSMVQELRGQLLKMTVWERSFLNGVTNYPANLLYSAKQGGKIVELHATYCCGCPPLAEE